MARERYSIKESVNRILRLLKGETVNETPGSLSGEVLSTNEAMSDIAELVNNSLPGDTFALPTAVSSAIQTAGFATGTATSLEIVSGTSSQLVGVTKLSFETGLTIEVTGTVAYIKVE